MPTLEHVLEYNHPNIREPSDPGGKPGVGHLYSKLSEPDTTSQIFSRKQIPKPGSF